DDLPIEMTALEKIFNVQHPGSGPLQRRVHAKYAALSPFAPEPHRTLPGQQKQRPTPVRRVNPDFTESPCCLKSVSERYRVCMEVLAVKRGELAP
ncbi:hypothetical protein, partial [Methylocella tundrae]|uniref:hypothetical protein n=1 Tax=Methylocella tundrae TaxID=227605 RepID=UPI001AEECD21